jgi:glutaconyl-CoA/methylmalonyl-CoA decarboxylase subunit delta
VERENTLLTFGLTVSLIGMGVVFVALVLLVCLIRSISKLAVLYEKSAAPPRVAKAKVPVRAPEEDDGEILAVIAAALAAHTRKP